MAQARLQALSEEFQKLQAGKSQLQTSVSARQKLEAQKQENLGVQQEFDGLKEGERIYKLVGPILLQQDKFEAEGTVKGRLDFIDKEMHEASIKDIQSKLDKKKGEIIQIQASAQGQQQQANAAA
ncbi:hypothetical protein VdG1_09002 [Verticillium dahliae VDG1]|nr:hypothetical protein VdG2_01690 [Verticillium dahliae VDG2]KAF3352315.1 hypothetical protein VdG1_09002 [Verticillium dahliae VDG1]